MEWSKIKVNENWRGRQKQYYTSATRTKHHDNRVYNSFPCVLSIQTALIHPIHSNAYDNFTEFSCSKSMNPNSNLNITE